MGQFMASRLKKINDSIFVEVDGGSSRPLEWRRSFNFVSFRLSDLTLARNYQISKTNYFHTLGNAVDEEHDPDRKIFPEVNDALNRTMSITGTAKSRDTINVAVKGGYKDPEDGIYPIHSPKEPITITLSGVSARQGDDKYPALPNCTYQSIATWNSDRDYYEDRIEVCCDVPVEYLSEIAEAIKSDPSLQIGVGIDLLTFTNEMDDALRDHWMRRDLILHEGISAAALIRIEMSKGEVEDAGDDEGEPVVTRPVVTQPAPYTSGLDAITQRLSKLSTPLWVLAGLLLLLLMK